MLIIGINLLVSNILLIFVVFRRGKGRSNILKYSLRYTLFFMYKKKLKNVKNSQILNILFILTSLTDYIFIHFNFFLCQITWHTRNMFIIFLVNEFCKMLCSELIFRRKVYFFLCFVYNYKIFFFHNYLFFNYYLI